MTHYASPMGANQMFSKAFLCATHAANIIDLLGIVVQMVELLVQKSRPFSKTSFLLSLPKTWKIFKLLGKGPS